jgi:hypothetical protein
MASRQLHALCRTEMGRKDLCLKEIRGGKSGVSGLDSEPSATTRRLMSVSRKRRIWKGLSSDFDISKESVSGSSSLLRLREGVGNGSGHGNLWLGTRFVGEDARLLHTLRRMSALGVPGFGM